MSEETIETRLPGSTIEPGQPQEHAETQAEPQEGQAGDRKRNHGRTDAGRAAGRSPAVRKPARKTGTGPDQRDGNDIVRAVKVAFAVAAAEPAVREALAAITGTGTGHGDAEALALAVATGQGGDQGLLIGILNLQSATPAEGMKTAIAIHAAARSTQRGLWRALTRLGAAEGDAPRHSEELALAIVEAGQGIPEHDHAALRAALRILAGQEG